MSPHAGQAVWRFREHAERTPAARRQRQSESRLREFVTVRFLDRLECKVLQPGEFAAIVDRIVAREIDPYTAADGLLPEP